MRVSGVLRSRGLRLAGRKGGFLEEVSVGGYLKNGWKGLAQEGTVGGEELQMEEHVKTPK